MRIILGAGRRPTAQHMGFKAPDKPALRLTATLAALLVAGSAFAQTPSPRPKPAPAHHAQSLPAAEFQTMARALEAAAAGDWAAVGAARAALSDPAAQKILQWRAAVSDTRATFHDLARAVRDLEGWPGTAAMRRDAEYALGDLAAGAVTRDEIVRWFLDFPPLTGEGKVAYAETLIALGSPRDAEIILRDAWRNDALRRDTQRRLIDRHAALFSLDDTLERVDYLSWADQRNMVRDILPLLPADHRALIEARLALAGGDSGAAGRAAALPADMQNDAGIVYERARAMRRAGDNIGAARALRAITQNPRSLTGRRELWTLRHLSARSVLEDGDPQTAYELVRDIGLDSGGDFADAEFLAGWIALRFLNDPAMAEPHFVRLAEGVSTPISVSRGWYWTGRAREAAGNAAGAEAAYAEAAAHPGAFYGQLASEKIDPDAPLSITPDPLPDAATRARFEAREPVRALHILGELGESSLFATLAMHLEDMLDDPAEIVLLSDLALDYGMQRTALRIAKDARNRALPIFDRAFPLAFVPPQGDRYVEQALALAISRQETEFEPRAVSGANARGLMQLLPATAQAEARRAGLPYRLNWLLDDPEYNARLGSAHLDGLIQNYNGSYIVSMAAYNAGPGRARQWIERFGDPRTGAVDPIDWIELVPFGETRNYIMRVMENLQVYRAQLGGGSAPLTVAQDLRRGEVPVASFR